MYISIYILPLEYVTFAQTDSSIGNENEQIQTIYTSRFVRLPPSLSMPPYNLQNDNPGILFSRKLQSNADASG